MYILIVPLHVEANDDYDVNYICVSTMSVLSSCLEDICMNDDNYVKGYSHIHTLMNK